MLTIMFHVMGKNHKKDLRARFQYNSTATQHGTAIRGQIVEALEMSIDSFLDASRCQELYAYLATDDKLYKVIDLQMQGAFELVLAT
jgi:hypothetical protein